MGQRRVIYQVLESEDRFPVTTSKRNNVKMVQLTTERRKFFPEPGHGASDVAHASETDSCA